jgi:hypothetical protein
MHNQFQIFNIVTKGIKQKLIQGNCPVALKPSKDKLGSIEYMEMHSSAIIFLLSNIFWSK